MLASLIVIVIILALFIYMMSSASDFFGDFKWPWSKPDPGELTEGSGYLSGRVLFNGGNLQLWTFAELKVGGQVRRLNVYEPSLIADTYEFILLAGTYTMEAVLYSWPSGDVIASQNYTSIVVVSQTETVREINFGAA